MRIEKTNIRAHVIIDRDHSGIRGIDNRRRTSVHQSRPVRARSMPPRECAVTASMNLELSTEAARMVLSRFQKSLHSAHPR